MSPRRSGWHRRRTTPADAARKAEYNSAGYRALRARLVAALAQHPGQPCAQAFAGGARCGRPMYPWQDLHLGHTDDRTGYVGLVHAACNLRAAAIKANQTRKPPPPVPFVTSRRW